MYRLTERDGILHVDTAPSGFALARRQAGGAGGSGDAASSAAAATTTTTAAATTTTAPATTTTRPATTTEPTTSAPDATTTTTTSAQATTTPADTTTTSAPASTTSAAAETTTTTSAADSTSTTSAARSTTSAAADTTVTRVITPTTVIVVGTSTFTSSLAPITSAETLSSSPSALPASSGSGLSTGAIAGIAVGSAVGGIIALSLLGWLCLGAARRRRDKRDADNILWPATGDSSALYPEPVHNTGRAGFGVGDDGDDLDEGAAAAGGYNKPGMTEVGAGAAGVGAAALGAGALGRYGSQREAQLPNVSPTVYASDYGHDSYGADHYYGGDASPPEGASAYTGYSNQTPSQHSHSALAPGMAGMAYGGAGAGSYERQSPSPPRFGAGAGGASADGHQSAYDGESQGGHMPFPGEADHEGPERSLSPRPMQVGDTFGQGYDETEGGKRWRLSVVNDDPLDRD
ncbi:hypothetical protein JCM3774_001706 [Rhodotorula dairenensis]